jgi:hypothetical protein
MAELRPVDWYLNRFNDTVSGDRIVFCGTIPTLIRLVSGADGFRTELFDPSSDAVLRCGYHLGCA